MLNLRAAPARHKTITHSPNVAACPRCGTWSPRNETTSTFYWEADLAQATVTEVRAGCYLCPRCPTGERWFKVVPAAYRTLRQYAIPARLILVDMVRRYNMSFEQAALFGREVLNLPKLNASTVLEWFRESLAQTSRREPAQVAPCPGYPPAGSQIGRLRSRWPALPGACQGGDAAGSDRCQAIGCDGTGRVSGLGRPIRPGHRTVDRTIRTLRSRIWPSRLSDPRCGPPRYARFSAT